MTRKNQDITRLLKNVNDDRSGALDNLIRAVYDDLQHVAERHMTQRFGHNLPGVTLEPAALVNESFLKIIKPGPRHRRRERADGGAAEIAGRSRVRQPAAL